MIRPIAIGRRNWLFTGSERAGKRAATIQTLLGTAILNGLDPAAWLRDTLEKLPACLNSEIDSLFKKFQLFVKMKIEMQARLYWECAGDDGIQILLNEFQNALGGEPTENA